MKHQPGWSRRDRAPDEDQFRGESDRGNGEQDVGCGSATGGSSLPAEFGHGQELEKALAIKNTNIVREISLPRNPARCDRILRNWKEATIWWVALFRNGSSRENPAVCCSFEPFIRLSQKAA